MSLRLRGMRSSQPGCPAAQAIPAWPRSIGASRYARNPFFHPTTPEKPGNAHASPDGVRPVLEQGVSVMALPPLATAAGTIAQSVVQLLADAQLAAEG